MSAQEYVFDPGVAFTLVVVAVSAFVIGLFVGRSQRPTHRPLPPPDFQLWRPTAPLPPHEVWAPPVSPPARAPPSREVWVPPVSPTRASPPRRPGMPTPGEIWWATVPYRDGTGQKRRPCLVLRTHATSVDVLSITSQDKSHRHDHVEVHRTTSWDPKATRNSYVDLARTINLPDTAFEARAGTCSTRTWTYVTQHHDTGWAGGAGLGPAPRQW